MIFFFRRRFPKTLAKPSVPALPLIRTAMSSSDSNRVFQLKVDPMTGTSEWVVIDDRDAAADENEPTPPHSSSCCPELGLLATTSYLDMLNDSRRNRAFREAIDKSLQKPCRVIDIGAGTGLLSMMAARAMDLGKESVARSSNEGSVTAVESYLPMGKLMRRVLRQNGMESVVRVLNKRSDEIEIGVDVKSQADVLVSEILDSELLGEGLIPTLQHAHDKLLVENPLTIPWRATVYGQLVESRYLLKCHDLSGCEAEAQDGVRLVPSGMEGLIGVKAQQHPMHLNAIRNEIKLVSEPFKIFEFEFWKRPESNGKTSFNVKAIGSGQMHAVVSWWDLQLDKEGSIFYSTAPGWIASSDNSCVRNWCEHWRQCVWFIPGRGLSCHASDNIRFHAVHDATSISYFLEPDQPQIVVEKHNFPPQDSITLSPERIAIYGDSQWRACISKAIENAMRRRKPSLCVVADDSIFLALLVAHFSEATTILAVFPGLRKRGINYLRAVAGTNVLSINRMEVLKKRTAQLTLLDTHHKLIDLFVAEPFYCGHEGMLPWQNLRFWKERTAIDSLLSEKALILPAKGLLKICAMSLPDLWNSRHSLGSIEGFDHSAVNSTLGACDEANAYGPCLPFFVWQSGEHKELSEAVVVMEFDFSKCISPCNGKVDVKFTKSGICHGLVLWIDWVMDAEDSIVVSSGPRQRFWKQGVRLLPNPVAAEVHKSAGSSHLSVEASFDPSSGELLVTHVIT
ncbi:hypothetical protein MLD38_038901 [Melastoma candidum]|uniref:Uncharacterized protein n=1 Tax=Melastoma candidum TaxID=119954 RepID=A0ACB9L1K3_9MYRT|nr:hypothetical protein MLD38_038901 [Melastoma candidum]